MSENELIWVSKELAEEYKNLDSVEAQEAAVKKIIERKRLDIEGEQELLSDSLLQFKSVCLVHRKELGKVYQEQADKLYELWEETGDISTLVSRHAKNIAAEIDPIRREIGELSRSIADLKKSLDVINIHVPEKLATVVSMVAAMDADTKSLMRDLLDRGRK